MGIDQLVKDATKLHERGQDILDEMTVQILKSMMKEEDRRVIMKRPDGTKFSPR